MVFHFYNLIKLHIAFYRLSLQFYNYVRDCFIDLVCPRGRKYVPTLCTCTPGMLLAYGQISHNLAGEIRVFINK